MGQLGWAPKPKPGPGPHQARRKLDPCAHWTQAKKLITLVLSERSWIRKQNKIATWMLLLLADRRFKKRTMIDI